MQKTDLMKQLIESLMSFYRVKLFVLIQEESEKGGVIIRRKYYERAAALYDYKDENNQLSDNLVLKADEMQKKLSANRSIILIEALLIGKGLYTDVIQKELDKWRTSKDSEKQHLWCMQQAIKNEWMDIDSEAFMAGLEHASTEVNYGYRREGYQEDEFQEDTE